MSGLPLAGGESAGHRLRPWYAAAHRPIAFKAGPLRRTADGPIIKFSIPNEPGRPRALSHSSITRG